MNWLETIKTLKLPKLQKGAHENAESGLCAMEMVAFLERLPHSDRPPCTCPMLATYTRVLNDRMPDDKRQLLLPILPLLVGTVSPEHKQARAELFAWRAIKVFAPIALEKIGQLSDAEILRNLDGSKGRSAAADVVAAAAAKAVFYTSTAASAAAASASAAAAADASAWELGLQALIDAINIGPSVGLSENPAINELHAMTA